MLAQPIVYSQPVLFSMPHQAESIAWAMPHSRIRSFSKPNRSDKIAIRLSLHLLRSPQGLTSNGPTSYAGGPITPFGSITN